jgi:hypothetical protein
MNTRLNKTNENKNLIMVSRGFLMTAVAAAVLNSAAYAQTNSSSGINRRAAEGAAKSLATTRSVTASEAPRAKSSARQAAKAAPAKKTPKVASQRSVKVIIRGDRNDVRQARQEGMQSLQNANAAVAARNAERAATAAAEAEVRSNNAALANQQSNFPSPYNYGYVPGGLSNPVASYGYGSGLYGATPTTPGFVVGIPTYGSPNVSFPSYYNTYNPGVFSSYSTFGPLGY